MGKDGDRVTKPVLDKVLARIKSIQPEDRYAKAMSLIHDHVKQRDISKPVVGITDPDSAEVREMDDGNFGIRATVKLDKTYKSKDADGNDIDYKIVADRIKSKIYPGFSMEYKTTRSHMEQIGDKRIRVIDDAEYRGVGLAGIRDIINPYASIDEFKSNQFFLNNDNPGLVEQNEKIAAPAAKNTLEVEKMVDKTDDKKPVNAPAEPVKGAEEKKSVEKPAEGGDETPKKTEKTEEEIAKEQAPDSEAKTHMVNEAS